MPLHSFKVFRVAPEFHSYGSFVIETESNKQDEILNLLADRDRRTIGLRLHIISNLESALPFDIRFELGRAYNVTELSKTPEFTTQSGHSIWIL
ncbi:MAG: hypothetical protein WB586_06955 [Chthoniobacterales bacterium]